MNECTHERNVICIPGSGSAYFCDDCGKTSGWFSYSFPSDTPIEVGEWKDYAPGSENAKRLWKNGGSMYESLGL